MPDLISIIKRAAVEAYEEKKPAGVCYGEVVTETPLEIAVEQKIRLKESLLVLTERVKLLYPKLEAGDKVILLRVQGGQQFIVLDRLGDSG